MLSCNSQKLTLALLIAQIKNNKNSIKQLKDMFVNRRNGGHYRRLKSPCYSILKAR
jgi:hypothetical protein